MRAAQRKAETAEQGVSLVRFGIVAFNSIVFAAGVTPGIPALAWSIIVFANIYSVAILIWPARQGTPLGSAWWTTTTDALLIVLWLTATGGAASPFFPLWWISIMAISFRFNALTTQVATLAYVTIDAALLAYWGALWPMEGLIGVRLAYTGLLGMMGAFMASSNMAGLEREEELAETSRQLIKSRAQLEAVASNAPSIILMADKQGIIQFINHTVEGFDEAEVVGTSLWDYLPDEHVDIVKGAVTEALERRVAVAYEVQGAGPGGELAWYQSQVGPLVEGGDVTGVVIITLDVTKEKERATRAAESERHALELERLQKEEAFRKQLLNAVAHELNTPLTPLKLQLHLAQRRLGDQKELKVLDRNVDRLGRIVEDLMDVARLEGETFQLQQEPHGLVEVIEEAAATFRPLAAERDVSIQVMVEGDFEITADRLRMTQVLYNLLSNAVKYSPEGGVVRVEARKDEHGVVCAVEDQGPGFDNAQLQQLFQPFAPIHPAPPHAPPSTGLGLYLTRGIVDAHGGRIEASSPGPGRGARFTFWLPHDES